jgi:hypothetical protein
MTSNSLLPALAAALESSATSDIYLRVAVSPWLQLVSSGVALVQFLAERLSGAGQLLLQLNALGLQFTLLLHVFLQGHFQLRCATATRPQLGGYSLGNT